MRRWAFGARAVCAFFATAVVGAVLALSGCSDGGSSSVASSTTAGGRAGAGSSAPQAPSPPASRTVSYEPTMLDSAQSSALTTFAYGKMHQGRVPEDVGMVVSPQPKGLPAGTVFVSMSYGSCGDEELRQVRLEGTTLVLQLYDPPDHPTSACFGTTVLGGLRVKLPEGATVTEVAVRR